MTNHNNYTAALLKCVYDIISCDALTLSAQLLILCSIYRLRHQFQMNNYLILKLAV